MGVLNVKYNIKQAEKIFKIWYLCALVFEFGFIFAFMWFFALPSLLSFGTTLIFLIITLAFHALIQIGSIQISLEKTEMMIKKVLK